MDWLGRELDWREGANLGQVMVAHYRGVLQGLPLLLVETRSAQRAPEGTRYLRNKEQQKLCAPPVLFPNVRLISIHFYP